jgi:hypothetical protein
MAKEFGHANFTDEELMQLSADIRAGKVEAPWPLLAKTKWRLHYVKDKKPITNEQIAETLDIFIQKRKEG